MYTYTIVHMSIHTITPLEVAYGIERTHHTNHEEEKLLCYHFTNTGSM